MPTMIRANVERNVPEAAVEKFKAAGYRLLTNTQEPAKTSQEGTQNASGEENITEKEKEARQTAEADYNISEYDFNRSVDTVSKLIGEPPPNHLTKAEIARQEEYARYVKQQEERQRQIEERRKNRNNKNIKNKNERSR